MKRVFWVVMLGWGAIAQLAMPSQAASLKNVVIDFSEYAFLKEKISDEKQRDYNLLDVETGAKLTTDNGDGNDFRIEYELSDAAPLSSSGTPNLKLDGKKIVSSRGFNKAVQKNNPGSLVWTTTKLMFSDDWRITDLQAKFTSLNTAGTLWEYSLLGFLKPDGSVFSPVPAIASYSQASGFTGSPSLGWYVAADKGTVLDVGSSQTAVGKSGLKNDVTLTYALAGLTAGTEVGGLVWMSYLEDVRGLNNGASSFTASWTEFMISGESRSISIPLNNTFLPSGSGSQQQVPGPTGVIGVLCLLGRMGLKDWRF